MTEQIDIRLELIDANPWQPRSNDDEPHIVGLAISIARDGLMQTPSARKVGSRYQLLVGHSRLAAIWLLRELREKALLSEISTGAESESSLALAWQAAHAANNDFLTMPLNIVDASDEGMFRAAISENEQRKDLGAVERARAMARYRDEFNKSSGEIGELFGVAPETVRGTLRYMELPLEVQTMLDRGEIGQGAARALLSMQRVAPDSSIVAAARSIMSNTDKMTPESIVQGWIEKHAYMMWGRGMGRDEDTKPRAGYKGWLLDMKNFPNRLLPDLIKSDLPGIFGMEQDTGLLKVIHKSETVVDVSMALGNSEIPLLRNLAGKIDILLDPPACSTCPLYTRVGGAHFCGLKACYLRKWKAWDQERVLSAGRELGIAPYQETDGAFLALETSLHKKLFAARGKDLRIIKKDLVRGYPYQYGLDGVDTDVVYVVVVGKTLDEIKAQRKAERALEKAGQKVIRTKADMTSDKKERLSWEVARYAGEKLFQGFSDLALNQLHGGNSYWSESGPSWAVPKRATNSEPYPADFLRRKLALNMLKKQIGYDLYRMGITQYADALFFAVIALGLDAPEAEIAEIAEMARVMQAEVEEQFPPEPVSAETETAPA